MIFFSGAALPMSIDIAHRRVPLAEKAAASRGQDEDEALQPPASDSRKRK